MNGNYTARVPRFSSTHPNDSATKLCNECPGGGGGGYSPNKGIRGCAAVMADLFAKKKKSLNMGYGFVPKNP